MRQLRFSVVPLLLCPLLLYGGGKIHGRVYDAQTKDPLVGAHVVIVGTSFGTTADPQGEFSLTDVPVGALTLRASFVGYASMDLREVRVYNGLTSDVDVGLTSEPLTMQTITVTAERPLVNKSTTNAFHVITSDEIRALPIRGVDNLVALEAGVVLKDGSIHIRGGRTDEVGFYLEGVSVTEPQYGGRAIAIAQEAVEEISVQSGGYEAEYGRANSGIVQYQLKSGGPEGKLTLEYITDNIAFQSSADAYNGERRLGAYWWGYSECTAIASGPVVSERIKGFGLFNYAFARDAQPQDYPGVTVGPIKDPATNDSIDFQYPAGPRPKNSSERMMFTGTLSFDFKPLIVRASGSYSKTVSFSSGLFDYLDLARAPETDVWTGFGSLKTTWFLNPSTYLELSGGWFFYTSKTMDPVLGDDFWVYGDSSANAQAGFVWQRTPGSATGPFVTPAYLSIYNFWFSPPGAPLSNYVKLERNNYSINAALSTQIGQAHTVKIGGDYQRYTIRTYQVSYPADLAQRLATNNARPDSDPLKVTTTDIMRMLGTNVYGYDLLGNPYDGDDFLGPRHPVFASLYAQDKIELADLVVNAGLRYDYISTNAFTLVDPTRPDLTFDYSTWQINPNGFKYMSPSHHISPRLGIAFPVSDRTVFHVQYSRLLQVARLRDVNVGAYAFEAMLRSGSSSYPIALDIRPTSTTQYEIGFAQQISDFASIDITAFYKDIKDQLVMDLMHTAQNTFATDYTIFVNGDYATTKGIELTFTMHRKARVQAAGSLSFQDARGSGSYPNSNWAIVTGTTNQDFHPQYIAPLDFENAVRGNMTLDYRFGKDDGGPVLEQLGATLLWRFHSGHPYTRTATPVTGRYAVEPLNSSTTPWVFQLDVRVDKTLRLFDRLDLTFYLYLINLFDTKNIENVFPMTGSPTDDGFINDPLAGGKLVEQYGPAYADLYNAKLSYSTPGSYSPVYAWSTPLFYGPPRQARFGIRLEY